MNVEQLRYNDISNMIIRVENQIKQLRSDSQSRKQIAIDLDKEADKLQKFRNLEVGIAASGSGNEVAEVALIAIERKQAHEQHEKKDAAHSIRKEVDEIDRQIKDLEFILRDLQKYERGIRDYQLKVYPLYQQAEQLVA